MITLSAAPRQAVVLPRGVETDGSATPETRLAAEASVGYYHLVAPYYAQFGLAPVMVYPGGRSFVAGDANPEYHDGEAMAKIALAGVPEQGLEGIPEEHIRLPKRSSDTMTNLLTAYEDINPREPLAIIALRDQLPRGLLLGHKVLGDNARLVPYEAQAERNRKAEGVEFFMRLLERAAYAGVEPGDHLNLQLRTERKQQFLMSRAVFRKALGAAAPRPDGYK